MIKCLPVFVLLLVLWRLSPGYIACITFCPTKTAGLVFICAESEDGAVSKVIKGKKEMTSHIAKRFGTHRSFSPFGRIIPTTVLTKIIRRLIFILFRLLLILGRRRRRRFTGRLVLWAAQQGAGLIDKVSVTSIAIRMA